jgi:hypothetical protein
MTVKKIKNLKQLNHSTSKQCSVAQNDLNPRLKSLELLAQVQYERELMKSSLEKFSPNVDLSTFSEVNSYRRFAPSRVLESIPYDLSTESQPLVRRNTNARELSKFTVGNFDTLTPSSSKLLDSQNIASHDRILYKYSISAPSSYKTSNFLTNLKRVLSKSHFASDVTNRSIWASNLLRSDVIKPQDYNSLVDSLKVLSRNKTLKGVASSNLYQKLENQEYS